jgi:hypothetical protein
MIVRRVKRLRKALDNITMLKQIRKRKLST